MGKSERYTQLLNNINQYMKLSLKEIEKKIKANDKVVRGFVEALVDEFDENKSADLNWDKYNDRCAFYWDDNLALEIAASMITPMENIDVQPAEDWEKSNIMTIDEYLEECKKGISDDCQGVAYYAFEDKVSDMQADPVAFLTGFIRKDFTHVCWNR